MGLRDLLAKEITNIEERLGKRRPKYFSVSRNFSHKNIVMRKKLRYRDKHHKKSKQEGVKRATCSVCGKSIILNVDFFRVNHQTRRIYCENCVATGKGG